MRMTMGIVIFHIDVPLAPDGVTSNINLTILLLVDFRTFIDLLPSPSLLPEGGERAWGIDIEFYLGSQTRLIFAFILTEEFWKNCFRRHAVWSQRDVDMKK
ncbi:hypothetical protein PRIPAC_78183 [Pristionchus pacificus]|uniref:Uncharacterized protein n=1 Tax=Pristionchus pacificus TaxID=54126 RepID=A0A2A6CLD0_PRIPA|nr:hypothetical protein PRIPAC_78183 [Pristionchus pacificus]|eukprot:PDM78910.1 hypothetical protein PRIPAC_31489 [Pristionchus pacificus]